LNNDCFEELTENVIFSTKLFDVTFLKSYLQNAETFECRCPRLAQIVDEKFQLELSWVGGAKADAPGKIGLNPGTKRNNPNFFDNHRTWELNLW